RDFHATGVQTCALPISGSGIGLSSKDWEILQKRTFYGKEKKSLAYIIGIMNMILHGVEAPNIIHTNTLAENLADIQEKDRYDVRSEEHTSELQSRENLL